MQIFDLFVTQLFTPNASLCTTNLWHLFFRSRLMFQIRINTSDWCCCSKRTPVLKTNNETTRFTSDAHLHLLSVAQVPTGAQTADVLNVLKPSRTP